MVFRAVFTMVIGRVTITEQGHTHTHTVLMM